MIVVDASVTLAWMLPDEHDRRAERALDTVRDDSAIAPSLWLFEVTNALLVAARRNRLDRPVTEILSDLVSLDIAIAEPRGFPVSEYGLAVEHNLSVYDSAYLHLAIDRNLALATLDDQLARAARKRKLLFT